MSRSTRSAGLLVGLMAALSSSAALAAPSFALVEDEQGMTLQIRDLEHPDQKPRRRVTSERGLVFFFPEEYAPPQRLVPERNGRLAYAQIGRAKGQLAVRLEQSPHSEGKLSESVAHVATADGMDIRIEDVGAAQPAQVAPPDEASRQSTLAALEASLGEAATPLPAAEAPPLPDPLELAAVAAEASLAPTAEAPEPSEASEAAAAPAEAPPAAPPPAASFVRASSEGGGPAVWPYALLLVMAAAASAFWWTKRHRAITPDHVMTVVSRIALGPRQHLVWIEAQGRQFLVGATDQRIALLTELGLPPSAVVSEGAPAPGPAARPTEADAKVAAFKAKLRRALGQELRDTEPNDDLLGPGGLAEGLPEHLRLLVKDPAWSGREDAA